MFMKLQHNTDIDDQILLQNIVDKFNTIYLCNKSGFYFSIFIKICFHFHQHFKLFMESKF